MEQSHNYIFIRESSLPTRLEQAEQLFPLPFNRAHLDNCPEGRLEAWSPERQRAQAGAVISTPSPLRKGRGRGEGQVHLNLQSAQIHPTNYSRPLDSVRTCPPLTPALSPSDGAREKRRAACAVISRQPCKLHAPALPGSQFQFFYE